MTLLMLCSARIAALHSVQELPKKMHSHIGRNWPGVDQKKKDDIEGYSRITICGFF